MPRVKLLDAIFHLRKINAKVNVPEVVKVHVNESKKKYTFFRKIFFQAVKD